MANTAIMFGYRTRREGLTPLQVTPVIAANGAPPAGITNHIDDWLKKEEASPRNQDKFISVPVVPRDALRNWISSQFGSTLKK